MKSIMDAGSERRSGAAAAIGIFDSGLGGLAVLREVMKVLPEEDVLYLGDTARRPYGPQPVSSVRSYAVEITGFLVSREVKAVIIGCNTASVAGADAARQCFPDVPVLDMVGPGVRAAIGSTKSGRIAVWGTALTIKKKAYDRAIMDMRPGTEVRGVACPDLLRLAERGEIEDKTRVTALAQQYFEPIRDFGADVLVLGCTDLTCVRDVADAVAGDDVVVVDPAEEVVMEAREALESTGNLRVEGRGRGAPIYEFLVTGHDSVVFAAFATEFLDLPSVDVKHVPLKAVQEGKLVATGNCE